MPIPNQQMQAILDAHAEMGPLPIESLTPELARQIPLLDKAAVYDYGNHITKRIAPLLPEAGKVVHKLIPGPESDLIARIYTPDIDRPDEGWPVIVYFHGGGWVLATLDTYDASCRALCKGAGAIVVSVHYRQAPEHRWPAAQQDAFAAYQWVCANAAKFWGDTSRVAVAGESAGGNLAAQTCLMARDKAAMRPLHQLLVYPVTDLAQGMASPSAQENASAKPLNTPMLSWFYDHYLPEGIDRKHPDISPLYADHKDLPPATVILAEIDPLRSEGEAYAKKLKQAGVQVTMEIYEGVTHEFFGLAGLVTEATQAMELACNQLRKAFNNEQSTVERVLDKIGMG